MRDFFFKQYDTRLYWLPFFLACGIGLFFNLSVLPSLWLLIPLWGISIIAIYHLRSPFPLVFMLGLSLSTILFGFILATFHFTRVDAPLIKERDGIIWTRATINSIEKRLHGYRIVISDLDLWTPETKKFMTEDTPTKARIEVRTDFPNTLLPGDRIAFKAKFHPPPPLPAYPASYDFSRYAYFNQIGAVGYAVSAVKPFKDKYASPSFNLTTFLAKLRFHFVQHIDKQLSRSSLSTNAQTIILALLFSERGHIPKDTLTTIREVGIGHLLAISGLHMALVMAGCYFVFRSVFAFFPAIALPFSSKKPAAIVALCFGIFYLILTGAPISAIRAYIMAAIFFLAIILDRQSFSLRPIAIAATIILCIDPYALLTPSFQMSFAAVTALIFFFSHYPMRPSSPTHFWGLCYNFILYILALCCSSFVAGLATMPFALYHFGYTATYSIFANMVAIPLTSFIIMPSSFIGLLTSFSDLNQYFFSLSAAAIELMLNYVNMIARFDDTLIYFSKISFNAILFYIFAVFGLIFIHKPHNYLFLLPTFIGLIWIMLPPSSPHFIMSQKGNLYAFRTDDDTLVFSSFQYERFARNEWKKISGNLPSLHLKKALPLYPSQISYKDSNLRFVHNKKSILIMHGLPFYGMCKNNDIIFNLRDVPVLCEDDTHIITKQHLSEGGTHAIWLDQKIKILTVAQEKARYYGQNH